LQDNAAVEAAAAMEKVQAEYTNYTTTAKASIGALKTQLADTEIALTTLQTSTGAANAASTEKIAALKVILAEGDTAWAAKEM
jgi:phage terminase large subunit-like protein